MESLIRQRWGTAVTNGRTGYTAVPDVLIRRQNELDLSANEMVVVLNLLLHWWLDADEWPYPRMSTIAKRMGTNRRTVERAVKSLESKGLVRRLAWEHDTNGLAIRRFDLSGLVAALEESAISVREGGAPTEFAP